MPQVMNRIEKEKAERVVAAMAASLLRTVQAGKRPLPVVMDLLFRQRHFMHFKRLKFSHPLLNLLLIASELEVVHTKASSWFEEAVEDLIERFENYSRNLLDFRSEVVKRGHSTIYSPGAEWAYGEALYRWGSPAHIQQDESPTKVVYRVGVWSKGRFVVYGEGPSWSDALAAAKAPEPEIIHAPKWYRAFEPSTALCGAEIPEGLLMESAKKRAYVSCPVCMRKADQTYGYVTLRYAPSHTEGFVLRGKADPKRLGPVASKVRRLEQAISAFRTIKVAELAPETRKALITSLGASREYLGEVVSSFMEAR